MIHKIGQYPRMLCGVVGGKFSNTGIPKFITCPQCAEMLRPKSRIEQLAMLERQIAETLTRKAIEGGI